jgi:hypothetical protein
MLLVTCSHITCLNCTYYVIILYHLILLYTKLWETLSPQMLQIQTNEWIIFRSMIVVTRISAWPLLVYYKNFNAGDIVLIIYASILMNMYAFNIYCDFFHLVGGGVRLGPLGTAATDWPIVACPGWLWWWRIWWNEDWQGRPKYSEKTRPLSTTNPTCPDPGSNPGRRGGKPATNRLSYGAASSLPNSSCCLVKDQHATIPSFVDWFRHSKLNGGGGNCTDTETAWKPHKPI